MLRRTAAAILLAGLGAAAGASEPAPQAPAAPPVSLDAPRVLFVGNSLTIAHDLPGMVAALSRAAGDAPPIEVERAAFGNFSLEDHWQRKAALEAIARGGWRFVVLQQGPSAAPENRILLRHWSKRFAKPIRAAGARPALYMVWPSRERSGDFPGVAESYRAAAGAADGVFLPAGEAWRAAWRSAPELELYAEDGLHPSPLGTYLAALVVYAGLSGRDPVGLATTLELEHSTVRVAGSTAALLQAAAREALAAEAPRR
jgi:hypothetical protein